MQYGGYDKKYRKTVQTLTYSGVMTHLPRKHGCVRSVRVGVRKGKVVIAVVINEAQRVTEGDALVEEWPRMAVEDLPGQSFRVLCVRRV